MSEKALTHKAKILIVEDEPIVAMHTKQRLERMGYKVTGVASSGDEALQHVQNTPPDLIIMDVHLQGRMDGVDTAEQILKFGELPIIYQTAYADEKTLQRAMQSSVDGYIIKPCEERELVIQVEIALHKHKLEMALRESEERYMLALQGSHDGIWDWDLRSNRVFYSERWKALLGLVDSEIGADPQEWLNLIHPDDLPGFQQMLSNHLDMNIPHFEYQHRIRHKERGYLWVLTRGLAVRDANQRAYRISGSLTDITNQKLAEEQLKYNALHDPLTGLPNRYLLLDRIAHAIELHKRNKKAIFAILYLDLDWFKIVNDSLGHQAGDALLVQVSKRLKHLLRSGDTIARLGGDEFAILLEGIEQPEQVQHITERILSEFKRPFLTSKRRLFISGSIGIVLGNHGYQTPEDLIRDADLAMYQAKNHGRFGYVYFNDNLRSQTVIRHELETMLRSAIERKEFNLNYQPIYDLDSGKISGFEALLRWHPRKHEAVAPDEFIPIAEEAGLMIPIGNWVLREACQQMVRWQTLYKLDPSITMNINISGKQFTSPYLSTELGEILKETGLDARCLKLEITENMFYEQEEFSDLALEKLSKMGIQLQIDDFGSGYRSLGFLERHPINTIKLDRSFVSKINSKDGRDITGSIIKMALDLGLEIVAEGIENEEQLSELREYHCQYGQGYLLGRPVEAGAIERILERISVPAIA